MQHIRTKLRYAIHFISLLHLQRLRLIKFNILVALRVMVNMGRKGHFGLAYENKMMIYV